MRNLLCDQWSHLCNNVLAPLSASGLLAPPPPPIRARPTPMDEERSASAIAPEPPDDGDPRSRAPQPDSHTSSTTDRASSCPSPTPCPSPGKKDRSRTRDKPTDGLLCCVADVFLCVRLKQLGDVYPPPTSIDCVFSMHISVRYCIQSIILLLQAKHFKDG